MSGNLSLLVKFLGVDKLSGAVKDIAAASKGASAQMERTQNAARMLNQQLGEVGMLRKANDAWKKSRENTASARAELLRLKGALTATGAPTQKMVREVQAAQKNLDRLTIAEKKAGDRAKEMAGKLRSAGVDVTRLSSHEKKLKDDLEATNQKLARQIDLAERSKAFDKFGSKVANAGQAVTMGLTVPIMAFGAAAIAAGRDDVAASAQVEQGLKTMGNASGRTYEQLLAVSDGLVENSLYAGSDILSKVTANMITFSNVSGTAFDRGQQAALDMSARLGTDLQGSAIMVGKALNDPAKGITALTRVGVSFSAQQKDMIKKMVATGDTAGAQAMILSELEKQYGGSAKAAADADPMAKAKQQFDELQGAIGQQLIPALVPLTKSLTEILSGFNNLSPGMQDFIIKGALAAAALGPLMVVGGNLIRMVGGLFQFFGLFKKVEGVSKFGTAMAKLGPSVSRAGGLLKTGFTAIRTGAMFMASGLMKAGAMMLANPVVLIIVAIVAAIGIAAYLIYTHWDTIKAAFWSAVAAIGQAMASAKAWVVNGWNNVKAAFGTAWAWLTSLPSKMLQMGKDIINGLVNGILAAPMAVWNALKSIVMSGVDGVRGLLNINSPSKLFMGFGSSISEGFALGIDRSAKLPQRSMANLAGMMGKMGAEAMASGGDTARFDPRRRIVGAMAAGAMALTPMAPASGAARAQMPRGATFYVTIKIDGAENKDARELAREIKRELEALDQSDARSSFEDQE